MQFWGKLRECAFAIYFDKDPLAPGVINWEGKPDQYDLLIGPAPLIRLDVKGSEWANAKAMEYVVTRWESGHFDRGQFTHLAMARGRYASWQELCGWMTKEEFKARHLIAPHPEYEFTKTWDKGTPFVPIEWLHPMRELLPKTRRWMEEARAYGFPATERVWADMKRRGVV